MKTVHRVLRGRWLRRRVAVFLFCFFYVGFRSGKPTWHLQLSLRGPWLLRLIRLPERTIGVRCRTLVWIQPSFSNWIRSLSGSHGLVLVRGRRDTEGEMIGHTEGKCGKTDRGRMKKQRNKCKEKYCWDTFFAVSFLQVTAVLQYILSQRGPSS